MIKLSLLLIGLILVVCESCTSGCKKVDLSQKDKEWFASYDLNDTVVFYSNQVSKIDSFIISEKKNIYLDCNRFERSEFQSNEYSMILKPLNFKVKNSYFAFIAYTKRENDVVRIFTVYDLHGDLGNDRIIRKKIKPSNFSDSIQVFTFEKYTSATSYGDGVITEFEWNKEIGLISYTKYDSLTYQLKSVNDRRSW